MIGMRGVTGAMQAHLATYLAGSYADVRTEQAVTVDDLPAPKVILVEDQPSFNLDELPVYVILPLRRRRAIRGDVDTASGSDSYKCTYDLRIGYGTAPTVDRAEAGRQRMLAMDALTQCLLRRPGIIPLNGLTGSATVNTGSLEELYGPIISKPNTGWYAESAMTLTVDTVEVLTETPLYLPPLDVILSITRLAP